MKFDAALVSEMIEKLAEPQYQGQEHEANVADFVGGQFTQIGMMVERREVVGSRFPQRVAPWVGWLGYGALVTASYVLFVGNYPLFMTLAVILRLVAYALLSAVLHNWIRIGRRRPPLQTGPLLIASSRGESRPPIRVVFQAVVGGLKTDFFQSLRLDRRWIAMSVHLCFLLAAVWQASLRPEGAQLVSVDTAIFAVIWVEIACVLWWELRGSRAAKTSQADARGLAALIELARTWPRTRSNQVEAVFVAAGGQRLDYAGAREVAHLLRSDWPSKPTLMIVFFGPGAGKELVVCEDKANRSGFAKIIDDAAKSLWIPIQRLPFSAIAPFWPMASNWLGGSIAIIGSDLNALSDTSVDPQVLHRAIQLSSEIALRWAKNQQKPADS